MKKLLLLLTTSCAVNLNAQTVWGVGSGVDVANAQFANPFVNATSFVAGNNPTSWTALSINQSGGSVTPGAAFWTRNTLGYTQGAYWGSTTPIATPSQPNGIAIFDSDYLDNNGVQGAFGTGTSPSAHKGELISPRIDLTGGTNRGLKISFSSYFRQFQINSLAVSFSTDDGATWTAPVDYRSLSSDLTLDVVDVNDNNVLQGVTNLTQCRLKFIFDGDYYFAIVDDVSLSFVSQYDFTIGAANLAGNTFAEIGDQLLLTNNRHFPLSQLTSTPLLFGANIKNMGTVAALATDSVKLNLTVQKNTGTWTTVYTQSILTKTTVIAGNTGRLVIDTLDNLNWLSVGNYRAIYTTSSKVVDGNLMNDSIKHFFTINDSEYASKVEKNSNNQPVATSAIFPGGGPYSAFEYGSVYSFPNAGTNNIEIDSVSFAYNTSSGFTGPANQNVLVNIYEWNDTDLSRTITDANELIKIGVSTASLTGLVPNTNYVAKVGSFLTPNTTIPMASLQNNKSYFVSILTNTSLFGGSATFDVNDVIRLGVSQSLNYNLNYTTDIKAQPSPVIITDPSSTTTFYGAGFGGNYHPSIGLHLNGCSISTATDVVTACGSHTWIDGNTYTVSNTTATHTLTNIAGCDSIVSLNLTITICTGINSISNQGAYYKVYPNRTTGAFVVELNYASQVIITNALGQTISTKLLEAGINNLDIQNQPAGVYFIKIIKDKPQEVFKLIKE